MRPRAFGRLITIQSILVIGLAAALIWSIRSRPVAGGWVAEAPRLVSPRTDLTGNEAARVELYRDSAPSVVNVTRVRKLRDGAGRIREVPDSGGSAIIWDTAGHLVTNFHLLEGADAVRVTFADGRSYPAAVAGVAPDKDLAVLRVEVDPERLAPIRVGRSTDLSVGQSVYAIGSPFGLDQTLTTGVVSGLGREITSINGRPIQDVIQTDAAINPGNSGGPLLDSAGRLIGVNTQIYSTTGSSSGVSFAIPIDAVNRIVPQLITRGKVTKPVLGITAMPPSFTDRYGIEGVVVRSAHADGAAAGAGILGHRQDGEGRWILGDILVAIDDRAVREPNDIYRILDRHQVGDEISIALIRENRLERVDVELTGGPP